jgi:hypothetical protein
MIFQNMNLDWLTCIQEFGVPLQVVNKTKDLNSNLSLNQVTLMITL